MLHPRNPWVAAFWSFAFPGCGALVQDRKLKGMLLILWELLVNTNAHINLSILYSLLGDFQAAKHTVNPRWLLLYIGLYVFAIWDSYRGTVDLNQQSLLADREDAPIPVLRMNDMDIHYLDKRHPWLAAAWSLFTPGLGHLYVHKVTVGLFMVGWTILVIYESNVLPAVHATLTGDLAAGRRMIDMQWLMYLPSIYGFVIYDSYSTAVEHNKLMEQAQSQWMRRRYQSPRFPMPL
ncbi:MAG: hypothetical protein K6T67_10890 [Alicyclobacillus sp.]|nr:hypothetical protein [Alicyclobacillus sp.]